MQTTPQSQEMTEEENKIYLYAQHVWHICLREKDLRAHIESDPKLLSSAIGLECLATQVRRILEQSVMATFVANAINSEEILKRVRGYETGGEVMKALKEEWKSAKKIPQAEGGVDLIKKSINKFNSRVNSISKKIHKKSLERPEEKLEGYVKQMQDEHKEAPAKIKSEPKVDAEEEKEDQWDFWPQKIFVCCIVHSERSSASFIARSGCDANLKSITKEEWKKAWTFCSQIMHQSSWLNPKEEKDYTIYEEEIKERIKKRCAAEKDEEKRKATEEEIKQEQEELIRQNPLHKDVEQLKIIAERMASLEWMSERTLLDGRKVRVIVVNPNGSKKNPVEQGFFDHLDAAVAVEFCHKESGNVYEEWSFWSDPDPNKRSSLSKAMIRRT